jgi:serine/threonine protein kinase/tetratricopeptide (TPR) repeat protein
MNVDTAKVMSIFLSAVEQYSPDQWDTFLHDTCRGNVALKQRVEVLLRAHLGEDDFLDRGNIDNGPIEPPIAETIGTVIGPYRLLEQIGEGGMGVVFLAEQSHPIQRTVALKIIKPGMDTRQVIGRFEAERQALGMLDHPNIARVLDAGVVDVASQAGRDSTDRGSTNPPSQLAAAIGRPYFVMELVKGVPISQYCDEHDLSVPRRLELMVAVCNAVQHAHQKGIIHRDLKPSNVLVAEYDGEPVPKIIDFGVAKAAGPQLTDRTLFTNYGQIVGTFEYMSPEQAQFNQLDVDTRSDIYSLGVMLYELLVGSTPLEKQRLETVAFDETLRIIREEEPAKPSIRLGTSATLDSIAASRQTEPVRLGKDLRGELDWIVMKCLEKDRNRRYESASALADDILRHLSDEPVAAGPPSQLYRARKFVRRNRVPVIAALFVAIAIIGGVAASTWQAVRALRAERSALAERDAKEQALRQAVASAAREEAQRKRAEEISHFLINAFDVEYPENDIRAVAEVLNNSEQKLEDAYANDPAAHAALLATMGRANVGLRRFDEAEQLYRKCLDVATDTGLIDRVRLDLGACLLRVGKTAEGVEILQGFYLDKLRRSDAPDAVELLKAWPGLPEVGATANGEPGMDGLEMDGDHDYVILPRIYFDARPPWTLEAIVRPEVIDQSVRPSVSPVGWTSLISATDGGAMGLETSRRRWAISLYTTRIPTGDWRESYSLAIARNEVSLNEWQHVAGVWDGRELRVYINGQLQDTRSGVDYCSSLSMAPMFLGADPDSMAYGDVAQGYLQGRLRVARISRSAEYTESFPRPEQLEKTPGTIGLYDFTRDTGRYAIDRSGHGNHGIIIGAKFARAEHE